jgi:hypothetical protein
MSATENFSDGSTQPNVAASYTSSNTTVATVSGSTVTSVNFSALSGPTTISGSYTDPQTLGAVTGNTSLSVTTAVQINALSANILSGDMSDFRTTVLGNSYVWGVNPTMNWNVVETSQGTYDFTAFDSTLVGSSGLFTTFPPNKKINIIVAPVTGGCAIGNGSGNPNCGNSSTPSYVLTNLVNAGYPLLKCTSYPGNGTSGATTNGGFPQVFQSQFYTPYESFIAAVLKHYSNACDSTTGPCTGNNSANGPALAPYIGYIRFGLSAGGEVFPFCAGASTYTIDTGTAQWTTYINSMDQSIVSSEETYQSDQVALGANIQMMTSINQSYGPVDFNVADIEADDAVSDSHTTSPVVTMGFGSQGLQKSDVANYASAPSCTVTPIYCPCTSDWCTKFNQYTGDVPLELQTVLLSDPTGTNSNSQTGSLATLTINGSQVTGLIPFATSLHTNILELYAYDMLYTFDSNYCSLSGEVPYLCPLDSTLVAGYVSTVENAVSGN